MSTILVNTLTGTSTAGSISVTGEGNSTTTNLQQGLAKAWVTHQHADSVDDSFNVSTVGDSGTGLYICNFGSNMNSTKYIVGSAGAVYQTSNSRGGDFCGMNMSDGTADTRATDHCDVAVQVGSTASGNALVADRDWSMHIFHGDLA